MRKTATHVGIHQRERITNGSVSRHYTIIQIMYSFPSVHNTGQRAVYHYHFSQSSDLRASGDCPHKCQNAPKAAILQKSRPPSKDRIRPISTRAATALPPNSCCCLLPAFLQLTREARRDVNGGEGNGAAG